MPGALRPAIDVPAAELERLARDLRRALEARGEGLSAGWTQEVVENLHRGELVGVCFPPGEAGGLAFFSIRTDRAYGHVHVDPAPGAAHRALALVAGMVGALPPAIDRLDFGATGLAAEEESFDRAVGEQGAFTVTRRHALERAVAGPEIVPSPRIPPGHRLATVRSVPLERLSALHLRSFRGSPDERLVASSPGEDRRVLQEILASRLGRFLDEASTVLVDPEGAPVGFVLTAEQDPRRAVFLDLVVDPALHRHGFGRFLLVWALRALWAFGFETGRLWVTDANEAARALYDHLGFRPVAAAGLYGWSRPAESGPQ